MQCALCHEEMPNGAPVIPVGYVYHEEIVPESSGIHLSCIQRLYLAFMGSDTLNREHDERR